MLDTLLKHEQQIQTNAGQAIRYDLERIKVVFDRMQFGTLAKRVMMITGTNGKGTVLYTLEAVYQYWGYRVLSFQSPVLGSSNEMIHWLGQAISEDDLLMAYREIDRVRADEVPLTLMEYQALAVGYCAKQFSPDILLLEVGMGGEKDAVNVYDADVAVVTQIGLDHMAYLGNSRDAIARAKSGIFRQSAKVVIGDQDPPSILLERADSLNTERFQIGRNFQVKTTNGQHHWQGHNVSVSWSNTALVPESIACALTVLEAEQEHLPGDFSVVSKLLMNLQIPGRWQCVDEPYPMVLDVAHNPSASHLLAQQVANALFEIPAVVFGCFVDKDVEGLVAPLLPYIAIWHLAPIEHRRPCAQPQAVAELIQRLSPDAQVCCHPSILSAKQAASQSIQSADQRVLVYGSFELVCC